MEVTALPSGEQATYGRSLSSTVADVLLEDQWRAPTPDDLVWMRFSTAGFLRGQVKRWADISATALPENVWPVYRDRSGHAWARVAQTLNRVTCIRCGIEACDVPSLGIVHIENETRLMACETSGWHRWYMSVT